MYRSMSEETISKSITVYDGIEKNIEEKGNLYELNELHERLIRGFLSTPSKDFFMELLTLPKQEFPQIAKSMLFNSIDCSINYSSIAQYLSKNKENILYNIMDSVSDFNPIHSYEYIHSIAHSNSKRSRKTSEISKCQVRDVKVWAEKAEIPHIISESSTGDFLWEDSGKKKSAMADGILFPDSDKKTICFLRYGTCGGGSQGDRLFTTFNPAISYPEKRFLFVLDGPECLSFCSKSKSIELPPNAIWSTVKLLEDINIDEWTF